MSDSTPHEPSDSFGESSVDPQSVEGLFLTALSKSTPEEREAFLTEACGDDTERRRRIEALLRAYDDAGSFLDKPPVGVPTEIDPQNFDFLESTDDPSLLGMLGPYEIYEVIGRGGMGIVFRARDPKLNRVVAVKVLAPELAANPNAKRRFVREAQAGAAISHPHVVTIHAVDDDEKIPYLVMECIVGQSLQQKLDKVGSLRLTEILRISKQIGEGLAAAHKQGLIHRDIKPANILLENGVERVKITDFGLARAVDDVSVTRTGEVAGSPQFMSPEQALGERVDQRSDLFSLGCVMYAMCAGRSPFRASNIAAAIRRVCDDQPRPIEEINPEVPEWLIAIIEKLLDKNPDVRFQTADELVEVLEDHLAGVQGMAQGLSRPVRETIAASPARTKIPDKSNNQSRQPISPFWYVAALVCLISVAFLLATMNSVELPNGRRESLVMFFLATKGLFFLVAGASIFVGLKLVQNLKLHADDDFKTENIPTQKFASEVPLDGPPLLERLSSSLMRLALLGPVTMLIGFFLWAAMPTIIEGEAVHFVIMGIGPILFGSLLIGWLGSHLQRVEWGLEAYYKGVVASFLALLLPLVWIVGIPTGLASLWVLNRKNVIDSYRRKGGGEPMAVPIPKLLLDIGTIAGALVSSSLVIWLAVNLDGHWSRVDIQEGMITALGLSVLLLPFRGQLFRGRFLKDLAICVGVILAVGYAFSLIGSGNIGAAEIAVIGLIASLLFLIPIILIWKFLIQPSLNQSLPTRIPLAQSTSTTPKEKWSLGQRLLFGLGLGVAIVSLQLLVPKLQQKFRPLPARSGTLTIHHNGNVKPVDIRIDGKQPYISRQSGVRTDITRLERGLRDVQISMKGASENLVRKEHYQMNIRQGKNHEITLRLPVKMNAGMDLGPASKEYGGLLLEIPDPNLNVLLMRFDSNDIGFRGDLFAAGEHQVPAGKYQVVVLDQLAGWLLDVKSDKRNQQSYEKVYNTIDNIFGGGKVYGGGDGDSYGGGASGMTSIGASRPGLYDPSSGTWSVVQYSIGMVEIQPGEFETVVAKRDLKAIALHHEEFVDGKFYRFLWNGEKYSFSATQARVMQELLQAYADGISEIKESVVLETLNEHREEPITSLMNIFNEGKHPGWLQLIAWTKGSGDASLNLTKLITQPKPAMSNPGFGGPPSGAFPQPKETGAVILTQEDSQISVAVSLKEFGPFQLLSDQTTSLPVGKYFVKVFDRSYGWGSTKRRGRVSAPSYDADQFVVKKGEFTDLEISRNWKKLAAQEPALMEGFYPFVWHGKDYILAKEQSSIVQQLFKAQTAEKIAVEAASLVESEDAAEEIKRIFNNGKHPAWDNLVRPLGDEQFRLKLDPLGGLMIMGKGLQLSYLKRINLDFIKEFKDIGQTFDILISNEKGAEPVPLITNASIFSARKPGGLGHPVVSLLLSKEQAEALEAAQKRSKTQITYRWGSVPTEFPQPVLNQKTYDLLKAKIKKESALKNEESEGSGAQSLLVPEKE